MQTLRKFDVDAFDEVAYEADPAPAAQVIGSLALAGDAHAGVASPARVLQQRLLEELAAEADDDDGVRWAPRTTLLFCGGVSFALWGLIALGFAAFH